jgi:hypothetical protein
MERTASATPVGALAALALGLALAALLLVRPGTVAAAEDCTLSATAPSSYYGIATITSGSVDCAAAKNVLRFSIALTRDGAVVASGERTCHKSATCWSYLLVDDPPGDQTTVSARVGSRTVGALTRCEADPAL